MSGWSFFATRLHGDGTEDMLAVDLPLADAQVERLLSGADSIRGTISPEIRQLLDDDGTPIIEPWSTALYAERDKRIVAGGIVQPASAAQGSSLTIEAAGFSHYPADMPYDGETYFVEVDALDIYRHIWSHLQSQQGGNLGLVLDSHKSGVLVGEELEEVEFTTGAGEEVYFEAGPFKLAWWLTDDLADRLEELRDIGGFEYREEHFWDGETIRHHLRFGTPRLGRRRQDLHFKAGDNLVAEPTFDGGDYASEVWALGAGEGRMMRVGRASRSGETRLRRVVQVADKTLTSNRRADQLAGTVLHRSNGSPSIQSITIHGGERGELIPDPGDEVLTELNGVGWRGTGKAWVRVLSVLEQPSTPYVTCEVEQAY